MPLPFTVRVVSTSPPLHVRRESTESSSISLSLASASPSAVACPYHIAPSIASQTATQRLIAHTAPYTEAFPPQAQRWSYVSPDFTLSQHPSLPNTSPARSPSALHLRRDPHLRLPRRREAKHRLDVSPPLPLSPSTTTCHQPSHTLARTASLKVSILTIHVFLTMQS